MDNIWTDQRKQYRYEGIIFSADGTRLKEAGVDYREQTFPDRARQHFHIWLAACLLLAFSGIPLLAYWGMGPHLLWIGVILCIMAYWIHQRIHACPGCKRKSRPLNTSHEGAPVLYLCDQCHTFFEHGQIDGGWPWKS